MDMNHLIGFPSYVGTLHEINPEASTIALENVVSFGTEGRRGNVDEVPPSTGIYEYIVFRGSDVKDISVAEEEKKDNAQPEPPRVPDDPAILGVSQNPLPPYLSPAAQPIYPSTVMVGH
ncbi:G2/M phase checkpoint control protein Sum2 [Penicillium chermesinum]|uniref:G2/M phase checkpoint control protein Sum2 n=1 Tax=Penicillium chermesinum TaxID=63820 RepID=A0A9W9PI66_9EURO|nr:G2/M phase checkpoint control protein Sum2 [Penicillium chermesinum]KAJ5247230.1 G2/M phase checkpoint control protein Sum2 [Penicillium chermesinum]